MLPTNVFSCVRLVFEMRTLHGCDVGIAKNVVFTFGSPDGVECVQRQGDAGTRRVSVAHRDDLHLRGELQIPRPPGADS